MRREMEGKRGWMGEAKSPEGQEESRVGTSPQTHIHRYRLVYTSQPSKYTHSRFAASAWASCKFGSHLLEVTWRGKEKVSVSKCEGRGYDV